MVCLSQRLLRAKRVGHLLWPNPLVKLLRGHETELERSVSQGEIFVVGLQSDLGCLFVPDVRIECRDEHERTFQVMTYAHLIWFESFSAMVAKRLNRFG